MEDSPQLSSRARRLILDADQVLVSAASVWESAIKAGLGKLRMDAEELAVRIDGQGFERLAIVYEHAVVVQKLPHHHRDPFERLLVAQAISERINLLTADVHLATYSDLVIVA
jgi:PIN domain nuclease of toxin-antitoxin system